MAAPLFCPASRFSRGRNLRDRRRNMLVGLLIVFILLGGLVAIAPLLYLWPEIGFCGLFIAGALCSFPYICRHLHVHIRLFRWTVWWHEGAHVRQLTGIGLDNGDLEVSIAEGYARVRRGLVLANHSWKEVALRPVVEISSTLFPIGGFLAIWSIVCSPLVGLAATIWYTGIILLAMCAGDLVDLFLVWRTPGPVVFDDDDGLAVGQPLEIA